jgi:hypothetical protein
MPPIAMALVYGFLFPLTHFDVENNEELMLALCIALLVNNLRGDVVHRQWLNWCRHVRSLNQQGLFQLYYRMSYEAFFLICCRVVQLPIQLNLRNQDPLVLS